MTLFGLLLYTLFFGFLTAFIAERKNYATYTWFWLGLFLGAIATVIISMQPPKELGESDASDSIPE
jgi:hypothetical protein